MARSIGGFDLTFDRVSGDVSSDRWLRYILGLTVAITLFGIWYRTPNFADPDEFSRLIQPMKIAGQFLADPSIDSIQTAITDGRALGATVYLYALALVPAFLLVVLTGQLGEFASLGSITSRWELWHEVPAWFWTTTIVLGRLLTLAFAVGCVYLTYRLGTDLRDRWTGRLAAVALALSVGFIGTAHVAGEDLPMLFFLLSTTHLAARFAESGESRYFFLGCVTGALSIALKLTGGVAVFLLGLALLLWALDQERPVGAFLDPRLLLGGLAIGLVTLLVGFPSVLFGGPDEFVQRITRELSVKTAGTGGPDGPILYSITKQYLRGFGWPLFLAVVLGVAGAVVRLARGRVGDYRFPLVVACVSIYLLVFSRWEYIRLHHLLPTFPFLLLLFADQARRFDSPDRRRLVSTFCAIVLVSSAVFAAVAVADITSDPRDRGTEWIDANVAPNETMVTYENSPADIAIVHGQRIAHYEFPEENATQSASLVLNESAFTEWMVSTPDRRPAYIQLTRNELGYLDGPTNSTEFPERREYLRGLVNGSYDYRTVAEFGTPRDDESIVEAGLFPSPENTASYVAFLEVR